MQRETIKITKTNIERALRLMLADCVEDTEIADLSVPGLLIRIRKRSAKWVLRCRIGGKQMYRTIGPLLALRDPDQVREVAEKAKGILREGGDPLPAVRVAAAIGQRRRRGGARRAPRRSCLELGNSAHELSRGLPCQ